MQSSWTERRQHCDLCVAAELHIISVFKQHACFCSCTICRLCIVVDEVVQLLISFVTFSRWFRFTVADAAWRRRWIVHAACLHCIHIFTHGQHYLLRFCLRESNCRCALRCPRWTRSPCVLDLVETIRAVFAVGSWWYFLRWACAADQTWPWVQFS